MKTRLAALLAAPLVLQGCALFNQQQQQRAAAAAAEEGGARVCTVSPVELSPQHTAATTMAVSDEGGWCAVRISEKDGQPFQLGLVRARPAHGRLFIDKFGTQTRVQYTPTTGYSGTDTFTVALRSRTTGAPDETVRVTVTVSRPT